MFKQHRYLIFTQHTNFYISPVTRLYKLVYCANVLPTVSEQLPKTIAIRSNHCRILKKGGK